MQMRNTHYLKRLMKFIECAGITPSLAQRRAKEIMGSNMIDIHEIASQLAIDVSEQKLSTLRNIPFSDETLRRCRKKYLLIPGLPVTIRQLASRVDFEDDSIVDKSLLNHNCSNDRVEVRWYLISKEGEEGVDERSELKRDEVTVHPCEMAYAIIVYQALRKKQLASRKCIFDCIRGNSTVTIEELGTVRIFHDEHGSYEGSPPMRLAFMKRTED